MPLGDRSRNRKQCLGFPPHLSPSQSRISAYFSTRTSLSSMHTHAHLRARTHKHIHTLRSCCCSWFMIISFYIEILYMYFFIHLVFFTFALFIFFTLYFVVFVVRRVTYRACSQASNYHKSHLRSLKILRDLYGHSHTCLCVAVQDWHHYYITRHPAVHIYTHLLWASSYMSSI